MIVTKATWRNLPDVLAKRLELVHVGRSESSNVPRGLPYGINNRARTIEMQTEYAVSRCFKIWLLGLCLRQPLATKLNV